MRPAETGAGVVVPLGPDGGIVSAGAADLDLLGQVIADAFYGLPPSRWLIPDDAARRAVFPGYFRLLAEYALRDGVVQTTTGRTAAALWIPVGAAGPGHPADYPGRLAAVTGPWADRFAAFDAALAARHPAGIAHHHLAILAVRPDRQGCGTGTALLRSYHREIDRDPASPAYLEAADERTRRVYLHRGYADHGPPVRLPAGPRMFPMWRQSLPERRSRQGGPAQRGTPPGGPPPAGSRIAATG
jgi:GNAT superfamily N-acetyltransferase